MIVGRFELQLVDAPEPETVNVVPEALEHVRTYPVLERLPHRLGCLVQELLAQLEIALHLASDLQKEAHGLGALEIPFPTEKVVLQRHGLVRPVHADPALRERLEESERDHATGVVHDRCGPVLQHVLFELPIHGHLLLETQDTEVGSLEWCTDPVHPI